MSESKNTVMGAGAEVVTPVVATEENTRPNTKNNPTSMAGVKKHKMLGEYKKCIVHPTRHAQQNTNVFVSIGLYTAEFKPEIEVELPMKVIEFLKKAFTKEHYYDRNARSDNGNKGAHLSRKAKLYIVEMV